MQHHYFRWMRLLIKKVAFIFILSIFLYSTPSEYSNYYESLPDEEDKSIFSVYEIGFASGYAFGYLHKTDNDLFSVFVNSFYFGYELNSILCLNPKYGIWQISFEPFLNVISQPNQGVEVGISAFIKYEYPLSSYLSLYAQVGAGPMYFGIETVELDDKGFQFLDQFGIGLHLTITNSVSLNVEYRYRHISNAGFREVNFGLDSNAFMLGLSFFDTKTKLALPVP